MWLHVWARTTGSYIKSESFIQGLTKELHFEWDCIVIKMASELSLHIKCSICVSDFTDPVMLSCEHSFCRQCITGHLQGSQGWSFCPECRRRFTARDLRPSRLLNNITGAVRQHLTTQQGQTDTLSTQAPQALSDTLVCTDHDEKLKLFCETCQKLLCVVCRDGERHSGHHFKPVKEAAQIIRVNIHGNPQDFKALHNKPYYHIF